MRSLSVWLAASSCAVAAVGCGDARPKAPLLPSELAHAAAVRAERVGLLLDQGRSCRASQLARRIQRAVIRAINARRVPPTLQEELLARANELAGIVPCRRPGGVARAAATARGFARWLRTHA